MLVCVSTYFLKCGSIFEKVLLKLSSTFRSWLTHKIDKQQPHTVIAI